MPLIHRRRVWWEPVPDVKRYVVYCSPDRGSFEPQNFRWQATPGILHKELADKTDLIIPDEWPEFPKEPGTYYLGVTAKDEAGNESDPFVSQESFKFIPPPPPSKGGIERV